MPDSAKLIGVPFGAARREHRRPREDRAGTEPAIAADGLTKVYDGPNGPITAIDDISLAIEPGTIDGILGPNGAGKTTLIKSILGLVVPTQGRVTIDGVDVHESPSEAYARTGAMLEGARNVYWRLTVRENLAFFASLAGRSKSAVCDCHDELLEWFDLEDKADETVNDLSRGMKQKVSLASTPSRGADVLFLDEPTLGLDLEGSLELRRELRRMVDLDTLTVVLSSHDMDVIEELCDRVIIMDDGGVIADDTIENLTAVFDSQAYEITVEGRLPDQLLMDLERQYVIERWKTTPGDNDRFEIGLPDGTAFYAVMNALETSNRLIVSVETITPALESVVLELTSDDRDGVTAIEPEGNGGARSTADDDGDEIRSTCPDSGEST